MSMTKKILTILTSGEAHGLVSLAEKSNLPIAKVSAAISNMRQFGYIESRPACTTYAITPEGAKRAQYTRTTPKPSSAATRRGITKTRRILAVLAVKETATYQDIQGATGLAASTISCLMHRLRQRGSVRALTEAWSRPMILEITEVGRKEVGIEKEIPRLTANETVARAIRTQPTSVFAMADTL